MARRMKIKTGNIVMIQPGEPSPGRDPYSHLAAKILAQAIEDFRSTNWIRALDSLLFFLDPDGAALFLSSLDFNLTDDKILEAVIRIDPLEKPKAGNKTTEFIASRNHRGYESQRIGRFPTGIKARASAIPIMAGHKGAEGEQNRRIGGEHAV